MLCMAVILMMNMTVYICTDVYVMYGCHSHGGHDGIYLYRCVCYVWRSFSWWTWRYISVQMCMLCMAVILMMDMAVYICTDVDVMYGCHSHDEHDGIYLYRCVCYVWLSFSWWTWQYISVQMWVLNMSIIIMEWHDGIYLYRWVLSLSISDVRYVYHSYDHSRHGKLTQCWFTVGPLSSTSAQQWTKTGSTSRVWRGCIYQLFYIWWFGESQKTRDVAPMLFQCWVNISDAVPALRQHLANVSCLLRYL